MSENLLDSFIKKLGKLPGLGPRSGRRLALHLIKEKETLLRPLAQILQDVDCSVATCQVCGNYDLSQPCHICSSPNRDDNTLCLVATVEDLWALERGQTYRGQYHVLGGLLSALEGVRPEHLTIARLKERLNKHSFHELIFALSPSLEGQTTAFYVQDQLKDYDLKISRLSFGLPMGGELDYLDEGTLTTALNGRVKLEKR
ncbi:MAG: recombination protein RecR [Alphaproteobacteria bacterium]|nr:MAG: recombination protein RecR [Alphaproteobacteria bacterium]